MKIEIHYPVMSYVFYIISIRNINMSNSSLSRLYKISLLIIVYD